MGGLPGITIPLVVYANGTLELKLGRDFDIHSILLLGKNPTKKSESWFRVAMASQPFELNLKSEIGGWASRESTLHLEEEKYFQSNILGIPHVLGFTESESAFSTEKFSIYVPYFTPLFLQSIYRQSVCICQNWYLLIIL